jgi:alkylhydroperoxidase family enzyme
MSMPPTHPWRDTAPEACAVFDRAEALVDASAPAPVLAAVRRAVAGALAHPEELERTPAPELGDDPRVGPCVAFAEQFVIDVAAVTDDQRAALGGALGEATFPFVQSLYVVDVFQRARITFERVFGTAWDAAPSPVAGDLWPTLEEFMRVVALGSALDPLTTELVRLRGARLHQCRVCQSRLSVRALDAAGSSEPFDALDDYEHADFTPRHKAALRLADAVVTQPAFIDAALVDDARAQLSDAEIVELVLDVTRNAANKIAVALGVDAPVVEDGVEYFDLDTTGAVVADVSIEVVRAAASGRERTTWTARRRGAASTP